VLTQAYKSELEMTDTQIEAYRKHVANITPLGRFGEPDEIAKAVSFLASDDASLHHRNRTVRGRRNDANLS
jgi:NAD(P)-dependent dehydrogenase (short-subunit alcohol dehydrogenase family)